VTDVENDTHHKALTINLDATCYGTIAEIGAGQEVARWFLQVGGASGTVAKTVSAYDMTVSDAIYGKATRYVSRQRVEGMLEHEYALLLDRLAASKGAKVRFFVFADTISARNFSGTNECHGWLGVRFQSRPGGEANQVIIHANLLDNSNLMQQQAVGILGVNLIHAAVYQHEPRAELLPALCDEIADRVEIDLIATRGPDLDFDDRVATIELLQRGFAEAVTFPVEGQAVPPSELIRKRPLVLAPDVFAPPQPIHAAMLAAGIAGINSELGAEDRPPLPLFMLVGRNLGEEHDASPAELIERVDLLRRMGSDVLVARGPEAHRIVRYALRYTGAPLRIVIGPAALAELLQRRYYRNLDGELMEALARLFASNVRVYVYPMAAATLAQLDPSAAAWFSAPDERGRIALEHLTVPPPLSHLLAYLIESGFLRSLAS
jgi:hypothetical protein